MRIDVETFKLKSGEPIFELEEGRENVFFLYHVRKRVCVRSAARDGKSVGLRLPNAERI